MYRNTKGLGMGCFVSRVLTASPLTGCKVQDVRAKGGLFQFLSVIEMRCNQNVSGSSAVRSDGIPGQSWFGLQPR